MYRTLQQEEKLNNDEVFGFFVDLFAGLGGLAYFFGTIFFFYIDDGDSIIIMASVLFTFGGTFFTLSGLNIVYRYFFLD